MLKSVGELEKIRKRILATDYLTVAQLFLQDNFLLERKLTFDDVKPRLLGHWGSCHGINVALANLVNFFGGDENFSFILGPGHGFPALNANLFVDGKLEEKNLGEFCRKFSWPGGFPSHSSPMTPGVVTEGGELGYALGVAFGQVLGHPEKTVAVLLGDGEMETATALASMNLCKLIAGEENGKVLPILHLNGYKISGPTILGRKSERELHELIRGFGYEPIEIKNDRPEEFLAALERAETEKHPFLVLRTEKGAGGPKFLDGKKVAGNFLAHQIPLPLAKSDPEQLEILESWLKSYHFREVYDEEKGLLI
ncbi:hypothetical protein IJF86_00520 [Candidatus Saccharibacteria bacterium]|nr:hypothetical protein [Candidatus Saccharibacteria bacterium]